MVRLSGSASPQAFLVSALALHIRFLPLPVLAGKAAGGVSISDSAHSALDISELGVSRGSFVSATCAVAST